jgi:hypothetical protein
MNHDNEQTRTSIPQYLPVDGKIIFEALKMQRFYVWEVGRKYYLWIDNEAINVESTSSLNRKLYEHGFLPEDKALIGDPHEEFLKICRWQSASFDRSVRIGISQQMLDEYRNARKGVRSLKSFFRNWMLQYYYPINTL